MSGTTRRDFIKGSAAIAIVCVLPAPVIADHVPNFTVRFQSWPFQESRPHFHMTGACSFKRFKELCPQLSEIYQSPMYWAKIRDTD